MGFGIGLGSFVDGFSRGVGIRDQMEENALRRKRLAREEGEAAELKGDRDYARDRLRLEDSREDAAYNRSEANRTAVENIETETKADFNEAVEAGTAKPDEYENFWLKYGLPKKRAELLAQGDVEGAKKLLEWGQSADALAGGKLFASAMLKAQTGDAAGALADAIEAGKVGGYIKHGYEVAGQQEIKDEAGNILGYRLSLTGPDGKPIQQDIQIGDVPRVIATFLNPDAAWESQRAASAKAGERQAELEDYTTKKKIDAAYDRVGGGGVKGRADAIKTLRERMDGGLSGKDPRFDDLPANEQERLISDEISLITGDRAAAVPAGPKSQVLVDTVTGQPVKPAVAPDPKGNRAAAPSPGPTAATEERLAPSDPATLPKTAGEERARLIQEAAGIMGQGGDPEAIRRRLMAAGVPQEQWPSVLNMAPGLGR